MKAWRAHPGKLSTKKEARASPERIGALCADIEYRGARHPTSLPQASDARTSIMGYRVTF